MKNEIFKVYQNKKVLITGNTGFKGSWMSLWLLKLGANVTGYSLEPPTTPSIYEKLRLSEKVKQYIKDIRSIDEVKKCLIETQPEIIFHFAAQPLVRESYSFPLDTFEVNVMGTATLLEAIRELKMKTRVVCVTSDKSYENQEWLLGYREDDPLGGHDPYSASKGAAELVISSYRRSFFDPANYNSHGVKVASVRAGNVIGGGDWAKDRIVPDCIRYLEREEEIFVRSPYATRPWQHVLEPLGGYLILGAKLFDDTGDDSLYCDAFNFGPLISSNRTVEVLVNEIIKNWEKGSWYYKATDSVHEASLLNLTIDKAFHLLDWQPIWDFEDTIKETVKWYKANSQGEDVIQVTENQIEKYQNSLTGSKKSGGVKQNLYGVCLLIPLLISKMVEFPKINSGYFFDQLYVL